MKTYRNISAHSCQAFACVQTSSFAGFQKPEISSRQNRLNTRIFSNHMHCNSSGGTAPFPRAFNNWNSMQSLIGVCFSITNVRLIILFGLITFPAALSFQILKKGNNNYWTLSLVTKHAKYFFFMTYYIVCLQLQSHSLRSMSD